MLTFRPVEVESTVARTALTRYFADRAAFMPWMPTDLPLPLNPEFTLPDGVFIVGELDGSAVACGGIRRLPAAHVRFEAKDVWVDAAIRGRGLGRALMRELERLAISLDADEIVLDTHEVLEAAVKMYVALGYESVPPYNDSPFPTHWFAKKFSGHSRREARAPA